MKDLIIGVDIGGTKIASGLVTGKGRLLSTVMVPTLANKKKKTSLEQVYASIEVLLKKAKKSEVRGVGLCAPGPLDPIKGIVHNPPNIPCWRDVPLASLVRKKFGLAAKLENDANAAAVAEMIWGAARGYKHIFYTTVSTGIGTGIIIDGKIYHGKNGMAGEGGHATINYDDKTAVCGCGNIGCAEALASGVHIEKQLKEYLRRNPRTKTIISKMLNGKIGDLTMKTVEKAAELGDRFAKNAIKEEAKILGVWLGSMISILDPEIIVIGGGISEIGEPLFREVRKAAYSHTINKFASRTPIVRASLRKNVGILGAASVFMIKS